MPELDNGVMYFGGVGVRLALTVRHGQIIACEPHRKWPVGRDARELWSDGRSFGAALEWEEAS